ncbi:MarR family transcriptional regulator [Paenibacillus sp. GD4]|uniref:MarR family winged helix-turn-helix transcriptional regulator n=1 Tax=Paenibacillus sp. GD4 TaxID=3068890 RepID=UPI0027967783|nr:MarR family transcriptional regulator [Paenibacillus sp. GD4]MDQ1909350.1 MarR family transcriptional regulator [Paenibacillus sp. GD4]
MVTQDFARLWWKLSKDLRTHMEAELAPTLTEGQLTVLELLMYSGQERMKPSDFIEYLATTPAAITTLLDRMEKSGLIIRERDEKDRRIVWVLVTEKGQSECERGMQVREQFLQSYLSRISSHNQQLLVYLLGKVTNAEKPTSVSV